MRTGLIACLLASAGAVTGWAQCWTGRPRPDRGGKLLWTGQIEAGLAAARRSGRPVMIYFTADW